MKVRMAFLVLWAGTALTTTSPARADMIALTGIGAGGSEADGRLESLFIVTGEDYTGQEFRSAFEFDLSPLPIGSIVQSAQLGLATGRPDLAQQTEISGYIGDGEMALSDLAISASLLLFTPAGTGMEFHDVTGFVIDRVTGEDTWAGFMIRQNPLLTNSAAPWEGPSDETVPMLVIEFVPPVPEPESLVLLGAGLFGFFA